MWRPILKTGASFRGVPFSTVDAEARIGRRSVLHEYPQRDEPFVEDLGRRARMFHVEAYVAGDDYLQRRDALIAAIEQAGPGELVHPRYGSRQVAVHDYVTVRESARDGGLARFSITFVEAGKNSFPNATRDTVSQVDQAAETVDDAAEIDFGASFDVAGASVLSEEGLKALRSDLSGVLTTVRLATAATSSGEMVRAIGGISDDLSTLIRTPATFVQRLRSLYSSLALAANRPLAAFADLENTFRRNARVSAPAALPGSTRARLLANEIARADLQRRISLSNQARALAIALEAGSDREPVVATAAKALELRDRVLALIDIELERNDPPSDVAAALAKLRASVTRDVAARAELLRRAAVFQPAAILPSLVLAHRIYQDANRADELEARNGVRHPIFVSPRPLEVLQ